MRCDSIECKLDVDFFLNGYRFMVDYVTYAVKKDDGDQVEIAVSDILEPIDDTILFNFYLGEMPGANVGTTLVLQYSDIDSKGELLSIVLIELPEWLVRHIEDGKRLQIKDSAKNVSIELTPEARDIGE